MVRNCTHKTIIQTVECLTAAPIRQMSGHGPRMIVVQPTRYTWNKWKDYTHFYTLVGAIPVCTLIFVVNVFIGPATLAPIPEGHRPEHWEYHRVIIKCYIAADVVSTKVRICFCCFSNAFVPAHSIQSAAFWPSTSIHHHSSNTRNSCMPCTWRTTRFTCAAWRRKCIS